MNIRDGRVYSRSLTVRRQPNSRRILTADVKLQSGNAYNTVYLGTAGGRQKLSVNALNTTDVLLRAIANPLHEGPSEKLIGSSTPAAIGMRTTLKTAAHAKLE